jgi:uncharacterized membrane protein HdeD (DUF308 family)
MNQFVSGAFVMACLAVALFFLGYRRRTGERLFALLAAAFVLLAVERVVLSFVPPAQEGRHWIFLARLLAFVIIIYGIVDKNRSSRPRSEPPSPPPSAG